MRLRGIHPPSASQSAIPNTAPATRATVPIALAPQPVQKPVNAAASTSQPSRHSATPAPNGVESSSKSKSSRSFWNTLGMEAFLDWITEPHNHDRLNKKRPTSGQRAIDLYDKISKYVFEKHKVNWDVKHIKYRMINARRKYDAARELSEFTGGGETRDLESLRKEMLSLCPPFDRLHAVWGGSLTRDPPPPRETCNRRDEEHFNKESSPEAIETDDDDKDNDDDDEDAAGVEGEDQVTDSTYMWMICMSYYVLLSCCSIF
ncbi:MAG: hypothetical protein BYD32DRAFT_224970 [Podila humilis]|nr:MAG: hypothetical protein BYD32DRAFT_224970 [Podila humilis]